MEIHYQNKFFWRLTGFYGFPNRRRRKDSWDLFSPFLLTQIFHGAFQEILIIFHGPRPYLLHFINYRKLSLTNLLQYCGACGDIEMTKYGMMFKSLLLHVCKHLFNLSKTGNSFNMASGHFLLLQLLRLIQDDHGPLRLLILSNATWMQLEVCKKTTSD